MRCCEDEDSDDGLGVWGVEGEGEASAARMDWDMSERRSDARFCDFENLC